MFIKARLGRFRLYFTDKRMRVRQERETKSKEERDEFWHKVKGPLLDEEQLVLDSFVLRDVRLF